MLLDALVAGKDLDIEKPLCQTPEQDVELVDAVERSKSIMLNARKAVEDGTLGNVRMVRCWWLNNMLGGGPSAPLKGPLDWEQWQGPGPQASDVPGPLSELALFPRLCGWHHGRPGCALFDGVQMLMEAGYVSEI